MTGYKSKRDMAEDKYFGDALTIAYQSGYYDGKKAAAQEPVATDWNAVHEKLCEVWNRQISADEGLDEIQDLINTTPAQPAQEPDTYRSVPHGHCTHPRCKEVFSAYIEVNKRLAHYEPEGKSPMILNAAPPQRKPPTT